jgi:hypothetical protein
VRIPDTGRTSCEVRKVPNSDIARWEYQETAPDNRRCSATRENNIEFQQVVIVRVPKEFGDQQIRLSHKHQ